MGKGLKKVQTAIPSLFELRKGKTAGSASQQGLGGL
jgi:hypothetical protein